MVAYRLRQPLIIGYVLAGILISPLTPGPQVSELHTIELLAEVGVILLMFSIGLEFSVRELLRIKWIALVGAPLGIVLCILLALGTGKLMGWSFVQGFAVGAIICVASTMVMTRLLVDNSLLQTKAGQTMVGITLLEDLAVVFLVILLPHVGNVHADAVLAIGWDLAKAVLILTPALLLASRVVPLVLRKVAQTEGDELFLMVVLAICLGTAALTNHFGLSLALGAFIAGVMVSGSPYVHQAAERMHAMKDAFVALFFVSVGLLIKPTAVLSHLPLLGVLLCLIIFGKLLIWTLVASLFRYKLSVAVFVGAGLTQIGEFSFILVQVAKQHQLVGEDVYIATLAASLISILINAAAMKHLPKWLPQQ